MEKILKQRQIRKRHKVRGKNNPSMKVLLSQPQIDKINDSRLVSLLGEMLALNLEVRDVYIPETYNSQWAVYLALNRKLINEIQTEDNRRAYELTQKGEARALNIANHYKDVSIFNY